MSVDTRVIIRGQNTDTVRDFIVWSLKGSLYPFKVGNDIDYKIELSFLDRTISLITQTWGDEESANIMAKKGDIHLKLGKFGYSKEIMLFIVNYFGGWFQEDDCNGKYIKIDQNNRDCIKYYFQIKKNE